jgi:hypothetical protein
MRVFRSLEGWLTSYQGGERTIYSAEQFIAQFGKVADGFERTLSEIRATAAQDATASQEQRHALDRECGIAEATAIRFRSCANQARFILARRALASRPRVSPEYSYLLVGNDLRRPVCVQAFAEFQDYLPVLPLCRRASSAPLGECLKDNLSKGLHTHGLFDGSTRLRERRRS